MKKSSTAVKVIFEIAAERAGKCANKAEDRKEKRE
jgi:hypothetical protein